MLKKVRLVLLFYTFFSSVSLICSDAFGPIESASGIRTRYNQDGSKEITANYTQYKKGSSITTSFIIPNSLEKIKNHLERCDSFSEPLLEEVNKYVAHEYNCRFVCVEKRTVKSKIFATCYSTLRNCCPSLLGQEDFREKSLQTIVLGQKSIHNAKMKRS